MAVVKAYCVSCKKKQTMDEARQTTMGRGKKKRHCMKGFCAVCETAIEQVHQEARLNKWTGGGFLTCARRKAM